MKAFAKYFIFCTLIFSAMSSSALAEVSNQDSNATSQNNGFTFWYGTTTGYGYVMYPWWPTLYWNTSYWNGYSYFNYYHQLPRRAQFAAISYSPEKDVLGGSWNQRTREEATYVANSFCGDTTCKPLVWVQGGCAAVITSQSSERVSWGTGINTAMAWRSALYSCHLPNKEGVQPNDCTRRGWVCSF